VLEAVLPEKDVDGFHPVNLGRLVAGKPSLVPCTPAGIMAILKRYAIPLRGKRAVVIGRSNIVGKPIALLLLQVVVERTARVTVTDLLGDSREIQCTQVLTIAEDRLRIEDATFGVVTIVRADLGKVWTFDRFLKVDFEADLKEWNAAHARQLDQIRQARAAVKGTDEEERLTRLLIAFGAYDGEPKVEVVEAGDERRVMVDGKQTFARLTLQEGASHYGVLAAAGGFHPAVAEKMKGLSLPKSGVERYVLLGRAYRVEFETTAVRAGEKDAFEPPKGYARAKGPDLKVPE
jgi:hypothetical protein